MSLWLHTLVQLMLFAVVEISLFAAYFKIVANKRAANNQKHLLLSNELRQVKLFICYILKKSQQKLENCVFL